MPRQAECLNHQGKLFLLDHGNWGYKIGANDDFFLNPLRCMLFHSASFNSIFFSIHEISKEKSE